MRVCQRMLMIVFCLFLSGCVTSAIIAAKRMNDEQLERAVTLIQTTNGQGCMCLTGFFAPPAGHGTAEVIGTIGQTDLMQCTEMCMGLRR